jgi:TRAP transporter TAXI family solute receptor
MSSREILAWRAASRLVLAFLAAAQMGVGIARANESTYLLATASTGGTFYPVGVALATLTQVKVRPAHGFGIRAINSAGSEENLHLLRRNETQFAILQGLFGHYAWKGTGPMAKLGPQRSLRAVTILWQNVEQFGLKSEFAKTGTVDDLGSVKGMKMALGTKHSGTLQSNRILLGNLGIDIDRDFDLVYLGYGPSADAVQSGRAVGMGIPAGVPTRSMARAKAAMGATITILNFSDEQVRTADGGLGLWTRYTIPANTYPNQEKPVRTIAQPNFLSVRSDVDANVVYQITKAIHENLPFLKSIHAAAGAMSIDNALVGLPLPLHPGALRYYREVGLDVPTALVPNQ